MKIGRRQVVAGSAAALAFSRRAEAGTGGHALEIGGVMCGMLSSVSTVPRAGTRANDLVVAFGTTMARPLYEAIQSLLARRPLKIDGRIIELDTALRPISYTGFFQALPTELDVPGLQQTLSGTPMYMTLKLAPERITKDSPAPGAAAMALNGQNHKPFSGPTTVAIDGLEPACASVKVEAFSVRASDAALAPLTFAGAVDTHTQAFRTWAQSGGAKNGKITLLDASQASTLIAFPLGGLTPKSFAVNSMNAGASSVEIMKLVLNVQSIGLQYP